MLLCWAWSSDLTWPYLIIKSRTKFLNIKYFLLTFPKISPLTLSSLKSQCWLGWNQWTLTLDWKTQPHFDRHVWQPGHVCKDASLWVIHPKSDMLGSLEFRTHPSNHTRFQKSKTSDADISSPKTHKTHLEIWNFLTFCKIFAGTAKTQWHSESHIVFKC